MSRPIFTRGEKEDLRDSGLVRFTMIPGKVLEQITLKAFPNLSVTGRLLGVVSMNLGRRNQV